MPIEEFLKGNDVNDRDIFLNGFNSKMSVDILSAFDTGNDMLPKIIQRHIEKYEVSFLKKMGKATINEIIRHRGIIDHIIENSSSRK